MLPGIGESPGQTTVAGKPGRSASIRLWGAVVGLAWPCLGLAAAGCTPVPDLAAERMALRRADSLFAVETEARGADGWAEFFVVSGVMLPQHGRIDGREAIPCRQLDQRAWVRAEDRRRAHQDCFCPLSLHRGERRFEVVGCPRGMTLQLEPQGLGGGDGGAIVQLFY